jgi:uncharacterized membrane-anchored protein
MKRLTVIVVCFLCFLSAIAGKEKKPKVNQEKTADSIAVAVSQILKFRDSVSTAIHYEQGTVRLKDFAVLKIPGGFKYLDASQSSFVIEKVWGNPKRDDVLGMIFPESEGPFTDSSFAFVVTFDQMGYVKDDDASDINYDDLAKEIRKDEVEVNIERKKGMAPSISSTGQNHRFMIRTKKYYTGQKS